MVPMHLLIASVYFLQILPTLPGLCVFSFWPDAAFCTIFSNSSTKGILQRKCQPWQLALKQQCPHLEILLKIVCSNSGRLKKTTTTLIIMLWFIHTSVLMQCYSSTKHPGNFKLHGAENRCDWHMQVLIEARFRLLQGILAEPTT